MQVINIADCIVVLCSFLFFITYIFVIFSSVRNKGGQEGSDPPKSMRDPCKVVICRDPEGVP